MAVGRFHHARGGWRKGEDVMAKHGTKKKVLGGRGSRGESVVFGSRGAVSARTKAAIRQIEDADRGSARKPKRKGK